MLRHGDMPVLKRRGMLGRRIKRRPRKTSKAVGPRVLE
jgi:hypothetical protein